MVRFRRLTKDGVALGTLGCLILSSELGELSREESPLFPSWWSRRLLGAEPRRLKRYHARVVTANGLSVALSELHPPVETRPEYS